MGWGWGGSWSGGELIDFTGNISNSKEINWWDNITITSVIVKDRNLRGEEIENGVNLGQNVILKS